MGLLREPAPGSAIRVRWSDSLLGEKIYEVDEVTTAPTSSNCCLEGPAVIGHHKRLAPIDDVIGTGAY